MSKQRTKAETQFPARGFQNLCRFFLLFLCFGLLTGFWKAASGLLAYLARGHFLFVDENFVWMTPLAEGVTFVTLGLLLLLLTSLFSKETRLFLIVGVLTFISVAVLFRAADWPRTYAFGVALLAAPLAAGYLSSRDVALFRAVQFATPLLLLLVALLAGGIPVFRSFSESRALSALPDAPREAPDILLLLLDTVRADAIGVYGGGELTPNIDALSEKSIVFENALAPAPWTLTTVASMFSGGYPHRIGTGWFAPLDNRLPLLAEILQRSGFETAGFVANLVYCGRASGLSRGFTHYEDYAVSLGQIMKHSSIVEALFERQRMLPLPSVVPPLGRKRGDRVTDGFLRWLDKRGEGRPYFAFLNYFDAHDPYLPQELYPEGRALTREEALSMRYWHMEDAGRELAPFAKAAYLSEVRWIDREIGRVLQALDDRGRRKNTLVILLSDHGEAFGRHGYYYHGNSLYRELLHVPLLLSWPARLPQGLRIQQAVSLQDIGATVLDIAGLKGKQALPGHSYRMLWDSELADQKYPETLYFSGIVNEPDAKRMHGMLHEWDFYFRDALGEEHLFDYFGDIEQVRELSADPAEKARLDQAKERLSEFLNSP